MNMQIWSAILTALGLAGFFLAGKKIWWAWYVNIVNQAFWLVYSIVTEQWPFLVGVVAYTIVFSKNAVAWTKEHKYGPEINFNEVAMPRSDYEVWVETNQKANEVHVEGRREEGVVWVDGIDSFKKTGENRVEAVFLIDYKELSNRSGDSYYVSREYIEPWLDTVRKYYVVMNTTFETEDDIVENKIRLRVIAEVEELDESAKQG